MHVQTKRVLSHEIPPSIEPGPWVVLVHYGTPELTRRCLTSLAAHETRPHGVVVVDHGPGEGLGSSLAGAHPGLVVIPRLDNPGFGAGCNVGAEVALAAGASALWFLNNDALVARPMLAELEGLAAGTPEVVLWGTLQREGTQDVGSDRQKPWFAAGAAKPLPALPPGCRQLGPQESLSGASLFLTRDAWTRLGPWPEDCFLYWEDTAWCHRAHRLSLPLVLTDLAVLHERSSTVGRRSPLATFYGVRNMLWLHQQIHPGATFARRLMALNLLQKRLFQGRFPLLRPTWDGLRAAFAGRRGRDRRY